MKIMGWVYLDGRLMPKARAFISAFDDGFLSAQGVFETMRSYDGCIFALERHLDRLIAGCVLSSIRPPSKQKLHRVVLSLVKKNRLKNARVRLTVSKKPGGSRVFAFAAGLRLARTPAKGFSIIVSRSERRGISVMNTIKSCSRGFYERLYRQARQKGRDEALFLNARGAVVEGTRTNIFMVRNGIVYTPPLSSGCLPGITRSIVIDQTLQSGIVVRQKQIYPRELRKADEIFLTNSVIEIMPVIKLDGQVLSSAKHGKITLDLMKRYKNLVRQQTAMSLSA